MRYYGTLIMSSNKKFSCFLVFITCLIWIAYQFYTDSCKALSSHSGVADGVGGWREYGVDPSQVPRTIMSLCARLVDNGKFSASSPEQLLEHAYDEASMHKDAAMGEV